MAENLGVFWPRSSGSAINLARNSRDQDLGRTLQTIRKTNGITLVYKNKLSYRNDYRQ